MCRRGGEVREKCPWKKQLKDAVTSQGKENPVMAFFRKEPLLFLQDIRAENFMA